MAAALPALKFPTVQTAGRAVQLVAWLLEPVLPAVLAVVLAALGCQSFHTQMLEEALLWSAGPLAVQCIRQWNQCLTVQETTDSDFSGSVTVVVVAVAVVVVVPPSMILHLPHLKCW